MEWAYIVAPDYGREVDKSGCSQILHDVGGVPERSKGTDCKSVGEAFEGSNPSPTTRFVQYEQGEAGGAWLSTL